MEEKSSNYKDILISFRELIFDKAQGHLKGKKFFSPLYTSFQDSHLNNVSADNTPRSTTQSCCLHKPPSSGEAYEREDKLGLV